LEIRTKRSHIVRRETELEGKRNLVGFGLAMGIIIGAVTGALTDNVGIWIAIWNSSGYSDW